ncbi:MAG TPA: hypothetical protein VJ770_12800 [Stellaceae bacterium]|nr:hypothetical protein [Stellaceae bacterium]
MNRTVARAPAALGGLPQAPVRLRPPADRILDELDAVVRKSGRKAAMRRRLHGVASIFSGLLSRMVPEAPPHSDPPPQIRFPFF